MAHPSWKIYFFLKFLFLFTSDALNRQNHVSTQFNSECKLQPNMTLELCRTARTILTSSKGNTRPLDSSFVPEWTECFLPISENTYICTRGQWKQQVNLKDTYISTQRGKRGRRSCKWFGVRCKRRNNPPTITCPGTSQKEYYTSKGELTVKVSWPSPTAYDQEAGGQIGYSQTQGKRSGTLHEEGQHLVTYMTRDSDGATATCSFSFSIIVRRCSKDYTFLLHGTVECSPEENTNIYGSTCSYLCNEGYELKGSKTSECQENGNWTTDKPFCQAISCGSPPNVQRGSFQCEDMRYFYQSMCAMTCDIGYETDKNDAVRCQSNKNWTLPGTCQDASPPTIDCSPDVEVFAGPKLANVMLTWNPPVTHDNSGDHVNVTSNVESGSFFEIGTTSVIFTATDSSNNVALCTKLVNVRVLRCPDYEASNNSDVSCSHSNAYGSVCTTVCQQAYELANFEESSQTCLEDQTWDTDKAICIPRTCASPPVIANGNFSCPDGMQYQDVCSISCDEGFTAQPPLTITCNINIEWSQTGLCLGMNVIR